MERRNKWRQVRLCNWNMHMQHCRVCTAENKWRKAAACRFFWSYSAARSMAAFQKGFGRAIQPKKCALLAVEQDQTRVGCRSITPLCTGPVVQHKQAHGLHKKLTLCGPSVAAPARGGRREGRERRGPSISTRKKKNIRPFLIEKISKSNILSLFLVE